MQGYANYMKRKALEKKIEALLIHTSKPNTIFDAGAGAGAILNFKTLERRGSERERKRFVKEIREEATVCIDLMFGDEKRVFTLSKMIMELSKNRTTARVCKIFIEKLTLL